MEKIGYFKGKAIGQMGIEELRDFAKWSIEEIEKLKKANTAKRTGDNFLIDESEEMSKFHRDYKEFLGVLIKLSKEASILDIKIDSIKITNNWISRYPNLIKDMKKVSLFPRIMGFYVTNHG